MSTERRSPRVQAEEYLRQAFTNITPHEREKLLRDWEGKEKKAEGLVSDFKRRAGDPHGKKILEIGFGNGLQLAAFSRSGAEVYGVEVNDLLVDIARENMNSRSIAATIALYDGRTLPYHDAFFDYAYATSVLEHVDDPACFFAEVARVLKPEGKLYLSFPNCLWPKETHTGVWFLSYLPRALSKKVLGALGRTSMDDWNLHFLSCKGVTTLARAAGFHVILETESASWRKRLIKGMLARLSIHHSALLRTVMLVLVKNK